MDNVGLWMDMSAFFNGKTNLSQAVNATLLVMEQRKGNVRPYACSEEYAIDCAIEAANFWSVTNGIFPRMQDVMELVATEVHLY